MSAQPAPLLFSTAFGALMVAAAAWPAGPAGLIAVALAGAAVLAGLFVRWAATAAVLLTVAAGALTDPPVLFAAVSGLSAPIDAFFDKVFVMTDDEAVRRNRLALLRDVAGVASGYFDLAQLPGF